MKPVLRLVFLASLLSGCFAATARPVDERSASAQQAITNWSAYSRVTAAKFIQEYGPPDRIEAGRLVWYRNGPWKRTEVWNLAGSSDNIEQTAAYHVPSNKLAALADFSDKVRVSSDGRELSARTSSEEQNFLALNLAAEIVRGYTQPSQARELYAQTLELRDSGKTSPSTDGLRFPPEP